MTGGITVTARNVEERVLIGTHNHTTIIVCGLRLDTNQQEAWEAACGIADTLGYTTDMLIDAANHQVRQVTITQQP